MDVPQVNTLGENPTIESTYSHYIKQRVEQTTWLSLILLLLYLNCIFAIQ